MHSGGMLAGWKFSNFKDGLDSEYFHVNDADGNLAHVPEALQLMKDKPAELIKPVVVFED